MRLEGEALSNKALQPGSERKTSASQPPAPQASARLPAPREQTRGLHSAVLSPLPSALLHPQGTKLPQLAQAGLRERASKASTDLSLPPTDLGKPRLEQAGSPLTHTFRRPSSPWLWRRMSLSLNHLGQKVLRKWKLGQSPNSTVCVICHFKRPPERTKV